MGSFIIAVICGLGVGVLSGLFGIGGGTVMVPIFRLGFGLSALASTGTSLFTMIFTSIAGSVTHIRNHTCIVPLGLLAGLCGATMSPLGVFLANHSPAWLVMLATALVIAYSSSTMLRKGLAMPKKGQGSAEAVPENAPDVSALMAAAQTESEPKSESESESEPDAEPLPQLSRRQYLIGALAGMTGGLAGGYVGLGGGFLMVPIFISGVGISMKHASGTSLFAIIILAAAGSLTQAYYGNLEVVAGLAMAMGSIPGAILGANFVKRVPERSLRIMFGIFMIAIAAVLAVNEFVF